MTQPNTRPAHLEPAPLAPGSTLQDAVIMLGDALMEFWDDGDGDSNTFTAFACSEIDALAQVLAAAGHLAAARHVISLHAVGDDDGDMHYTEGKYVA